MTRYYIEIHEDGQRIPAGGPQGYPTQEQAAALAIHCVDDALPLNTIHVLKSIGHAYLAEDGQVKWTLHED